MTPAVSEFLAAVYVNLAPLWVELAFLVFFALGFAFLRVDSLQRGGKKGSKKDFGDDSYRSKTPVFDAHLLKAIELESSAGNSGAVVQAWRAGQAKAATPLELLKLVVEAFLAAEPDAFLAEIIAHMRLHGATIRVGTMILDAVARAGQVEVMMKLWGLFQSELKMGRTHSMYEVVLAGFATVGDCQNVKEVSAQLKKDKQTISARGYSLMIKGFLKNGMLDAVQKQIFEMRSEGHDVPIFALSQFFRIAAESKRVSEMFASMKCAGVKLPVEALVVIIEDCLKAPELRAELAREAVKALRAAGPLPQAVFDPLLKLYTLLGDVAVLKLFEEMQTSDVRISEGLCVGLLARCADTKFLRFAEEIVRFCRARDGMTISIYSALMKVYAYCGMYDKACDLYDNIRQDGLEPDSMMYGCLMKFSVECGRTQLSQELSEKAPSLDIQNFMSLIRAAGRDRDIDRAYAVLQRMRDLKVALDVTAYNCVLDVCVQVGDMKRAKTLLNEMREQKMMDVISYNTFLKGYTSKGDLASAKALIREMEAAGMKGNDVTYNCLINCAVSTGNFKEAWDIIDLMERSSVKVDHYTISIMMKALKKIRSPKDVNLALQLFDRTKINVCSDEILFNTVLETCIRHKECWRLEAIMASYQKSGLRPSVHTYGALIKAAGVLKQTVQVRQFWREMEDRGQKPNDIVLGCMLDALVCNSLVEEAVEHFNKWKGEVQPNTVLYSTLVKGFANTHQDKRAMDLWREMRTSGLAMNTVVYNSLIDTQARVGNMDEVSVLVKAMDAEGCVPDSITYSTIVKGYCVKGDLEQALEVLRGMQESNMAHDAIVYNTILDGCTRHNRGDLADKLLAEMEALKVPPSNFTLGILVKMYGRRRMLDKAFEAIATLPKRGNFTPNAQVRTCLMCACLSNNATSEALAVFEELKSSPFGADAKAYSALISALVRQGKLLQAVDLVDELCGTSQLAAGRGSRVQVRGNDLDFVDSLLSALAQKGLMEQHGSPLLERLHAAKVPLSGRIMASPAAACRSSSSSPVVATHAGATVRTCETWPT